MFFFVLWIFDALVAGVFLLFFAAGLADGSVSSFNIGLWLGILAVFAGILAGSWILKRKGHARLGLIVLALPGLPAVLYLLLMLSLLILQPDWR